MAHVLFVAASGDYSPVVMFGVLTAVVPLIAEHGP